MADFLLPSNNGTGLESGEAESTANAVSSNKGSLCASEPGNCLSVPPKKHSVYCFNEQNAEHIPAMLREYNQWITIRLTWNEDKRKFNKMPFSFITGKAAKSNDPDTWGSYGQAVTATKGTQRVIAFCLANNGITVIDIDHCVVNGDLSPVAKILTSMFAGTYMEWSVSGNGIHIFILGNIDMRPNQTLVIDGQELEIEVYSSKKFIAMTGELLEEATTEIREMPEALNQIRTWCAPKRSGSLIAKSPRSYSDEKIPLDMVKKALESIDSSVYSEWIRGGFALKRWGISNNREDEAWTVFDEWSKGTTSKNYDPESNRNWWDNAELRNDDDHPSTASSLIRNAPGLDLRAITSVANGSRGGRPPAPAHADAAAAFYQSLLDESQQFPRLRLAEGQWWAYEKDGWVPRQPDDVNNLIVTFMQDTPELRNYASSSYIRSLRDNLVSYNLCGTKAPIGSWITGHEHENADNWMAFSNDVSVNVWELAAALAEGKPTDEEWIIRPKSPAFFSKAFVPYPFEKPEPLDTLSSQIENLAPRFMTYLEEVQTDAENRRMLQQMTGIALTDITRFEKMFFLTGQGANGKSVFVEILTQLVGTQNVSSIEPHTFSDRFSSWILTEHKLNIAPDLSLYDGNSSIAHVEAFLKKAVTGEMITVEKKYQAQRTRKCTARQVFVTNHLPMFQDRSDAINRRTHIIDFPVHIPKEKQDIHLARNIAEKELPGIFLWGLSGLADILRNELFEGRHARSLREEHFRTCNKELVFFETHCILDSGCFTNGQQLYNAYQSWCENNGYRAQNNANFFRWIEQKYRNVRRSQKTEGGVRQRGYEGIYLHNLNIQVETISELMETASQIPQEEKPQVPNVQD